MSKRPYLRIGATDEEKLQHILSRCIIADCWIWQGAKNIGGYGAIGYETYGTSVVHRFVWTQLVGPIQNDLHLDHLCRNVACCNPDHLEPVTSKVNTRRGYSPAMVTKRTGICRRGHTVEDPKIINGLPTCKECYREAHNRANRKYKQKIREMQP